jgi:hypothetical protein
MSYGPGYTLWKQILREREERRLARQQARREPPPEASPPPVKTRGRQPVNPETERGAPPSEPKRPRRRATALAGSSLPKAGGRRARTG